MELFLKESCSISSFPQWASNRHSRSCSCRTSQRLMRQVCFSQGDLPLPSARQFAILEPHPRYFRRVCQIKLPMSLTYMIRSIQDLDIFKFSFQVDVLVSPKSTYLWVASQCNFPFTSSPTPLRNTTLSQVETSNPVNALKSEELGRINQWVHSSPVPDCHIFLPENGTELFLQYPLHYCLSFWMPSLASEYTWVNGVQ